MPELAVLIVTYNNEADITACLDSVAAIEALDVETVVVDNGSADASVELARAHPSGPTVVASSGNLGFGGGVNLAATHSSAPLLLLLNPDAQLLAGAAERLVALLAERPQVALAGGLTQFSDGRLNPNTVRRLPTVRSSLMFATALSILWARLPDFEGVALPSDDEPRRVEMLTGSLMLVRRDIFEQLGGFDDRIFMYSEDTDLCERIGILGHEIVLDPKARIVHDGGASTPDTGRKAAMMMAGRATYIRLRWSGIKRRIGLGCLWMGVGTRALAGLLHPKARRWRVAWQARRWWFPGYRPEGPHLPPT